MDSELAALCQTHLGDLSLDTDLDSVVIVSGLPNTPLLDKLQLFIRTRFLTDLHSAQITFLRECDSPTTCSGAALVATETASDAQKTVQRLDGVKIDKTHQMKAMQLCRVKGLENKDSPIEYTAANSDHPANTHTQETLKPLECLLEGDYIVQQRTKIVAHTTDGLREREAPQRILRTGKETTQAEWTPTGTYLALTTKENMALHRYNTQSVYSVVPEQNICETLFAPDDSHLVTLSSTKQDTGQSKSSLKIWRISPQQAQCCRHTILQTAEEIQAEFSPDSQQLALLASHGLDLYQLNAVPGYDLIQSTLQKTLSIPHATVFSWRPHPASQPQTAALVYGVAARGSIPFRLYVADRRGAILKTRGMYNVVRCTVAWGDGYVVCLFERIEQGHRRTKMEVIHVEKQGMPVESLEFSHSVSVLAVPLQGSCFLVSSTEQATAEHRRLRNTAVYAAPDPGQQKEQAETEPHKAVHKLLLCRNAKDTILAAERPARGVLSAQWTDDGAAVAVCYKDIDEEGILILDQAAECVGQIKTRMCRAVAWNSSGTYLLSYSNTETNSPTQTDCCVYDSCGRRIRRDVYPGLVSVCWRPDRLRALDSSEQEGIDRLMMQWRKEYNETRRSEKDTPEKQAGAWKEWMDQRREQKTVIQHVKEQLEPLCKTGFVSLIAELQSLERGNRLDHAWILLQEEATENPMAEDELAGLQKDVNKQR